MLTFGCAIPDFALPSNPQRVLQYPQNRLVNQHLKLTHVLHRILTPLRRRKAWRARWHQIASSLVGLFVGVVFVQAAFARPLARLCDWAKRYELFPVSRIVQWCVTRSAHAPSHQRPSCRSTRRRLTPCFRDVLNRMRSLLHCREMRHLPWLPAVPLKNDILQWR